MIELYAWVVNLKQQIYKCITRSHSVGPRVDRGTDKWVRISKNLFRKSAHRNNKTQQVVDMCFRIYTLQETKLETKNPNVPWYVIFRCSFLALLFESGGLIYIYTLKRLGSSSPLVVAVVPTKT